MGTVNITDINDYLATLLGAVTGIVRHYSYDELPESHNEMPAVEVYPDSGDCEMYAFKAGVYRNAMVFFADFYVTIRSNLPDDIGDVVPYIDRATTALEGDRDLGGNVKGLGWTWSPRAR